MPVGGGQGACTARISKTVVFEADQNLHASVGSGQQLDESGKRLRCVRAHEVRTVSFRKKTQPAAVPDSPDKLLLELPRRKIPDVLPHQREVMRTYAQSAVDEPDVALQLPTGSGKTLVGLLIAEWRRRKFNERVVYLCPTRQLVHQTTEQGEDKYGLTALPFTGQVVNYDATARAEYRQAQRVAVTTYNSLFNTNPFFDDADVVIVDDAHASENYIANMWSLRIDRTEPQHAAVHSALATVLKPQIAPVDFSRMTGTWSSPSDRAWVDKLPGPTLKQMAEELGSVISVHAASAGLQYSWSLLQENLCACQLYMSAHEILIRPLIPPTWTHLPFSSPRQRLFMSATLGAGGDLERLTGRKKIARQPIPDGWEHQGVGRRFFMFPGMALTPPETEELRLRLMREAHRSLVLVPNDKSRQELAQSVENGLGFKVFSAGDIEQSKKTFIDTADAVAAVANRYDGIDFPGDECRLLFVDGLPRATNAQERFLMTRMGANILFNERVQTRVLQSLGRCTRSLEDFSAVVVTGEELQDYLTDIKKREFLHPELQAEIAFGVDQSMSVFADDFFDNFCVFIDNGKEWEEVNQDIVAARDAATRTPFPAIEQLTEVVEHEIGFQESLWVRDYESAIASAEAVLAGLLAPELRGYRALWHYLAGSAAWLGSEEADIASLAGKSRLHFNHAKKASAGIPWLVGLSRFRTEAPSSKETHDSELLQQIERVETVFANLGVAHDAAYSKREKEILDGLLSMEKGPFEEAHKKLGEMLGFVADNVEEEGSPDPWWISKSRCFVFEDHQGAAPSSELSTKKARQVSSHPNWIRQKVCAASDLSVVPVLVTPVETVSAGAVPHLKGGVLIWKLDEFRDWARNSLALLREVRRTFVEPGDLAWRAEAASKFDEHRVSPRALLVMLQETPAENVLGS